MAQYTVKRMPWLREVGDNDISANFVLLNEWGQQLAKLVEVEALTTAGKRIFQGFTFEQDTGRVKCHVFTEDINSVPLDTAGVIVVESGSYYVDAQNMLPEWDDALGTAVAWDDALSLEASLRSPGTGTAPGQATWKTVFSLYDFVGTANKYLQSVVQLPHGYVPDSNLSFHVHFVNPTQISAGNTVKWTLDVVTAGITEVFDTNYTTYTSTLTAASNIPANTHCMSSGVVVSGTGLGDSGILVARIGRDITDTHPDSVYLLSSDYHIRKDSLGSTNLGWSTS